MTDEHPILINCEIKLTRLFASIRGTIYIPPFFMNDPHPYLWAVFLQIDGSTNHFVFEKRGSEFIGRFEKKEDYHKHVHVDPGSGGVSQGTFGHGNIGPKMDDPGEYERDLESIFIAGEGYPFQHDFGDLVPIVS